MTKLQKFAKEMKEELNLDGAEVEISTTSLDGIPRVKVTWRGICTEFTSENVDNFDTEEFREALVAEDVFRKGLGI
jgi:hypothetical protein